MKTYAYEEMPAYIERLIASGTEVLYCHSRRFPGCSVKRFIRLPEDVCYEPNWHGGPVRFPKGSYLHVDTADIYGLTEETFSRCYIPQ